MEVFCRLADPSSRDHENQEINGVKTEGVGGLFNLEDFPPCKDCFHHRKLSKQVILKARVGRSGVGEGYILNGVLTYDKFVNIVIRSEPKERFDTLPDGLS